MFFSAEIINQVLPILLLIFLGNRIKVHDFLSAQTVEELKGVVVNLALPAVLFLSFTRIELHLSYLSLSIVIFSLCILLLFLGRLFQNLFAKDHPYSGLMIPGFEYGMLGVSLFGSAYGLENLGYIAIVDLGHELFIWFVLLPILLAKRGGGGKPLMIVKTFMTNPVVIAIISGLLVNSLGIFETLSRMMVVGAIFKGMEFLSGLTIPLILIIVGYGLQFKFANLKDAFTLIICRYIFVIPILFIVNTYLIRNVLQLERGFEMAFVTLMILPSPFIIPFFMKDGLAAEKEYVNTVLAVQTVITIVIFSIYVIVSPQI